MAYPVLRHRLFTNFNADAEGIDVDQVIEKMLETVPEPTYGETMPAKPRQADTASRRPARHRRASVGTSPWPRIVATTRDVGGRGNSRSRSRLTLPFPAAAVPCGTQRRPASG